jgi:tetratricopeptide (TPR) repeat protein
VKLTTGARGKGSNMKRIATIIGLLSWLSLACTAGVRGQDKVQYVDRKTGKDAEAKGAIQEESPAGITLKQTNNVLLIPATDIHHVIYRLVGVTDLEYRRPFDREKSALAKKEATDRRMLLTEALLEYEKLAGKMRDNANANRYFQYRMALVQVYLAREDAAKRDEAIEVLNKFRKENSTGWEIVPCLKQLAQFQEEKGDLAGAQDTYKELRSLPGLSRELVMESNILVSSLLMRGKKYTEAEKSLQEVRAALPDGDPQKPMIVAYLCQAQMKQNKTQDIEKQLTYAINSSSEAPILAVAHNTLGDYFRMKNQDEDAFWHYLRVDVLYPGDREEHAKALYWLSKLFESVKKDKAKAQECVEKLKSKDFEGTEYARLLAAEK